jgi:hypothetical protein
LYLIQGHNGRDLTEKRVCKKDTQQYPQLEIVFVKVDKGS